MATSITANVAGVFANGATVGAYPKSNWVNSMVNESAAPVGSATATGTVSAGSVTINSLTTDTEYVLAVSGAARYLSVSTRDETPRLASDATQSELDAVAAASVPKSIVDAKGDLIVATAADTVARKAVGANDTVLTADSSATGGVKWSAASTPNLGTYFSVATMGAVANVVPAANNLTFGQVRIPAAATLTGVGYWVSAQNGNVKSSLYDAAGTKVAEDTSGAAVATGNTFQKVPFDTPYAASAGIYYVGVQFSGTGGIYSASGLAPGGTASPGAFSAPASITPPTTPRAVGTQAVLTTY